MTEYQRGVRDDEQYDWRSVIDGNWKHELDEEHDA